MLSFCGSLRVAAAGSFWPFRWARARIVLFAIRGRPRGRTLSGLCFSTARVAGWAARLASTFSCLPNYLQAHFSISSSLAARRPLRTAVASFFAPARGWPFRRVAVIIENWSISSNSADLYPGLPFCEAWLFSATFLWQFRASADLSFPCIQRPCRFLRPSSWVDWRDRYLISLWGDAWFLRDCFCVWFGSLGWSACFGVMRRR